MVLGLGYEIYKMNREHLIDPEIKEMLQKTQTHTHAHAHTHPTVKEHVKGMRNQIKELPVGKAGKI